MAAFHVRRDKAALFQWVQAPPATAPAGSDRSRHGGDEVSEAFGYADAAQAHGADQSVRRRAMTTNITADHRDSRRSHLPAAVRQSPRAITMNPDMLQRDQFAAEFGARRILVKYHSR